MIERTLVYSTGIKTMNNLVTTRSDPMLRAHSDLVALYFAIVTAQFGLEGGVLLLKSHFLRQFCFLSPLKVLSNFLESYLVCFCDCRKEVKHLPSLKEML